jgi:hypothetical protein
MKSDEPKNRQNKRGERRGETKGDKKPNQKKGKGNKTLSHKKS